MDQIGKKFGCSRQAVHSFFKGHGIKGRKHTKKPLPVMRKVRALLKRRTPPEEIVKKLSVSRSYIRWVAKRWLGIKIPKKNIYPSELKDRDWVKYVRQNHSKKQIARMLNCDLSTVRKYTKTTRRAK